MGYDFVIGKYRPLPNKPQQNLSGGVVGLEGAYFLSKNIGIGGRITAANICYNEEVDDETIDNMNFMIGPYYSYPFNKNWSMGSKLLTGLCVYSRTVFDGVTYKSSRGPGMGTGISITYRLNRNYNMHVFCDFNIYSPYKPFFSGYIKHMAIGGSTSISF